MIFVSYNQNCYLIFVQDVECFGDDTCYAIAFAIPAILMFVATLIIIMGKPLYRMVPPQGNILTRVFGSIGHAVKRKRNGDSAEHWMDLAKDKYEPQLVEDVKCVLRVLVLYLPLPVWWALFDQTGSRWTFQATRMNGVVGNFGTIKPDQMQVINPLLILFLLPLFDKIIYPAFAKCNMLVKPLQRMTAGGIVTASAFFLSGFLEMEMMKTYAKVPNIGFSNIHFMNNIPCNVSIHLSKDSGLVQEVSIAALENLVIYDLESGIYSAEMEVFPTCLRKILTKRFGKVEIMAHDKEVTAIFLGVDNGKILASLIDGQDDPEKDDGASGRLRVIHDIGPFGSSHQLSLKSTYKTINMNLSSSGVSGSSYSKIDTGAYM